MTGRNSKPKNNGPAASPSRLDQFGSKLAEETVNPARNQETRNAEDKS